VFEHGAILQAMYHQVRNSGETGITSMAISAIDNALWDLRARLLDTPLVSLLGSVRHGIPVYGSGGFTSYNDAQLQSQLGGWAEHGFRMVKMKIGTHPDDDLRRVEIARKAIGDATELFVDANGAYTVTQALQLGHHFGEQNVRWFEEPVSSDNLGGLGDVRSRAPIGMDIAAGEYGYTAWYFDRMLKANAVTVLQADATRCGGISGFLNAAALCWAANMPLSSHCGPSMHVHVCCAVPRAIHMEFFHDHVRIERMFFDGFCEPVDGVMSPDRSRPGAGLTLERERRRTLSGLIVSWIFSLDTYRSNARHPPAPSPEVKEKRCGEAGCRFDRRAADRMGSRYHFWFSRRWRGRIFRVFENPCGQA
jgi:L-alanine-DL-glutamate epimerase-like enolase superfamily enzyme